MKKIFASTFAAAAVLMAVPAAAVVVQGDFRAESDLPDYSVSGPKLYENLGAVLGAGFELGAGNFVSNPSGWGGGEVFADWDAATNILTLSSQDTWDFQTFNFTVNNVLFDTAQTISGFTLIGGNLTDANLVPTFGFTGNSLFVSYAAPDNGVFNFTGTSAQFQVALSDVAGGVPEPATWAMLIIGFGAVGVAARRSRRGLAKMAS